MRDNAAVFATDVFSGVVLLQFSVGNYLHCFKLYSRDLDKSSKII
jgi:hypothetical protein